MCGIAGYIDFKNSSGESILKRMTDTLHHRGPEGEGYLVKKVADAQVGLGHRRLCIIDLSPAASQPMSYDGLHIIFNGEIYNYNEIRDELLSKGHTFSSHSDTEVILHSIREWGLDAVHRWIGMFAIVLLDEKTQEVICIRDRAGVKPFYYFSNENLFLFGSELKAIMQHPAFTKEVSVSSLGSYLQYGYVPSPHSIFTDTYKLPAGHYLRLHLSTRHQAITQYWNVYDSYNKPRINISLPDAIEETERILEKSFQYRMVADVPVGVFLSGGFDSTCVTALLQKNSADKIKTFTIGTTDKRYNEAPFAKQIAGHLGTDHEEYYCNSGEALEIIPELPEYYDEPFADSSAVPTILVSRLARKKVTVALSADAGDEIFGGYNKYAFLLRNSSRMARIPKPVRKAVAGIMERVSSKDIPYLRDQYNFHSRYQKLKAFMHDPSTSAMMKNMSQAFTVDEVQSVLTKAYKEPETSHTSNDLKDVYYDQLSYMLAVDYQTYMVDDILQKVDRATMSVSLEGREPFLDQHIIEWVAQLPSAYKYHNGEKKYLLKQIVYKYIPPQMMDRPKMGFSIPVDDWLQNELKDLVMNYLNERALSHGLLQTSTVLQIRDAFLRGKPELHLKIWYILMFQMWYERWMK